MSQPDPLRTIPAVSVSAAAAPDIIDVQTATLLLTSSALLVFDERGPFRVTHVRSKNAVGVAILEEVVTQGQKRIPCDCDAAIFTGDGWTPVDWGVISKEDPMLLRVYRSACAPEGGLLQLQLGGHFVQPKDVPSIAPERSVEWIDIAHEGRADGFEVRLRVFHERGPFHITGVSSQTPPTQVLLLIALNVVQCIDGPQDAGIFPWSAAAPVDWGVVSRDAPLELVFRNFVMLSGAPAGTYHLKMRLWGHLVGAPGHERCHCGAPAVAPELQLQRYDGTRPDPAGHSAPELLERMPHDVERIAGVCNVVPTFMRVRDPEAADGLPVVLPDLGRFVSPFDVAAALGEPTELRNGTSVPTLAWIFCSPHVIACLESTELRWQVRAAAFPHARPSAFPPDVAASCEAAVLLARIAMLCAQVADGRGSREHTDP